MAFRPIKEVCAIKYLKMAASTTITKGSALVDDGNGLLTNASSSTTEVLYVSAEAKTSASGETPTIGVYDVRETDFEADTDANPAQTDVFTKADLATVGTVNPDASTNKVFFIEAIVGAVTDKKVKGCFVQKTT